MGSWLAALIEAQRPSLALWIPVLFGLGIALYFVAPSEPSGWMLAVLCAAGLGLAVGLPRAGTVAAF